MSDRPSYADPNVLSRIRRYRLVRRRFSFKVYALASIFALISLLHWSLSFFLTFLAEALRRFFFISMICLFVALVIVTAFALWERLRVKSPINWILTGIFVECMSLGLMVFVSRSVLCLYGLFVLTACFVVICVACGIFIPRDLTLDVVILFVFAIIFFIGSVLYLTLTLLANIFYSVFIYVIFVVSIVVMFILFHAQTIHGERYGEMRVKDYLLASIIIYSDFVILFTMASFLVQLFATGEIVGTDILSRNCTYCGHKPNHPAVKYVHDDV